MKTIATIYIDGQFVTPHGREPLVLLDPATRRPERGERHGASQRNEQTRPSSLAGEFFLCARPARSGIESLEGRSRQRHYRAAHILSPGENEQRGTER